MADEACQIDGKEIYNTLYKGGSFWQPGAFGDASNADPCNAGDVRSVASDANTVARVLGQFGAGLLVIMTLFEVIRRLLEKESLGIKGVIRLFASAAPVAILIGAAFTPINGMGFVTMVKIIILNPIGALSNAILGSQMDSMIDRISKSYALYSSEGSSGGWSNILPILKLSVPSLIAGASVSVALIVAWVMSMYISVITTILDPYRVYLIGAFKDFDIKFLNHFRSQLV
jgi:hypothetical protein